MSKLLNATKKITAVAASTLLLSSATFSAGLNDYSSNFVKDGKFVGQVVVGSSAGADDMTAANLIINQLKSKYSGSEESYTLSYTKSEKGGKSFRVEDKKTHLYVGDTLNSGLDEITDKELPVFLANGVVLDGESKEYKYEQKIIPGEQVTVEFGREVGKLSDQTSTPVPYLNLNKGDGVLYTLEVDFKNKLTNVVKQPTATEDKTVANQKITLFGSVYTFDAEANKDDALNLFSSTQSVNLKNNIKKTVEFEGNTYNIEVIEGSKAQEQVKVTVNGETAILKESTSKTVGGLKIRVNALFFNDLISEKTTVNVEFGLGTGGLVIPTDARNSWADIEIDGDAISGYQVKASVEDVNTWDDMTKLEFRYLPRDLEKTVETLSKGESIKDLVFPEISVAFDGLDNELTSGTNFVFSAGGKDSTFKFTNSVGNSYLLKTHTGIKETFATGAIKSEVSTIKIVGSTTAAGFVAFTLNGINYKVPVETGKNAAAVAVKVREFITSLPDYTVDTTTSSDAIVITSKETENHNDINLGTQAAGLTITVVSIVNGASGVGTTATAVKTVGLYNDKGGASSILDSKKLVISGNLLYKNNMFFGNEAGSDETYETESNIYSVTSFNKKGSASAGYEHTVKIKNLLTGKSSDYENGDEVEDTGMYVQNLRDDSTTSYYLYLKTTKEASSAAVALNGDLIGKGGVKFVVNNTAVTATEMKVDYRESKEATGLFNVTMNSENNSVDTEFDISTMQNNSVTQSDESGNVDHTLTKTGMYVKSDSDSENTKISLYAPNVENAFNVKFNVGAASTSMKETVLASKKDARMKELKAKYGSVAAIKNSNEKVEFSVTAPVKDSEATKMGNIVVGGPMVNSVAVSLLNGAQTLVKGEAMVKYFKASNSILAYGYTKAGTLEAVKSLNSGATSGAKITVKE